MSNETIEETFDRWLEDEGDWIGVFENKALDSATCGQRCAIPFTQEGWDQAVVGKTSAPDMQVPPISGIGWKFILIGKCKTKDEVLVLLENPT